MFQQNEDKYLDLTEWADTLTAFGINMTDTFPRVAIAMARTERLETIKAQHRDTTPDVAAAGRRIGLSENLEDTDNILATANLVASGYDEAHRERVAEILDRAIDAAMGEAVRAFRKSDILGAIRPTFDQVAARITNAAATIPQGVLNLEDAARLGHADTYQQLERDMKTWKELANLISRWHTSGILPVTGTHYPIEFMVDDVDAYREATASSSRPLRNAAGITAGKPRLHIPDNADSLAPVSDSQARAAAYYANETDKAARADLGLPAHR